MNSQEENLSITQEINEKLKSLFSEMHDLLAQSKTNSAPETSQKLVECFHKMDTLQKKLKQQLSNLHLKD